MFTIKDEEIVKWPVVINMPVDGGNIKKHRVMTEFLLLTDEATDELTNSDGNSDLNLLQAVVKGWGDDIKNEDKTAVECNDESIARLMSKTYVKAAFITAYFMAKGGQKAQTKN